MKRNSYTSNLIITDIHINGEKKEPSYRSTGITLSHKENSFSINYETLDMKFPNKIEYAYRLKGFDNWNYVKTTVWQSIQTFLKGTIVSKLNQPTVTEYGVIR